MFLWVNSFHLSFSSRLLFECMLTFMQDVASSSGLNLMYFLHAKSIMLSRANQSSQGRQQCAVWKCKKFEMEWEITEPLLTCDFCLQAAKTDVGNRINFCFELFCSSYKTYFPSLRSQQEGFIKTIIFCYSLVICTPPNCQKSFVKMLLRWLV